MAIKIKKDEENIYVSSPYNKELIDKVKMIGGRWHSASKSWKFDIRDEDDVRDIYELVYGEYDRPVQKCTVRYFIDKGEEEYQSKGSIFMFGREIARAYGRDSGAELGRGIKLVGCIAKSGGSVKNWSTDIYAEKDGAYIEIKDVPVNMVNQSDNVMIITDSKQKIEQLKKEKETLLSRLDELNYELDELEFLESEKEDSDCKE